MIANAGNASNNKDHIQHMHALAPYLENLTVRAADDGDQAFLKQLYASTRDDLRLMPADPAFVDSLIVMQQNIQVIGYRNAYPEAEYLVLESQGEAIGRIVVHTGTDELRLVDISLLPQARGKGFGTAILRALQKSALQKNLPLALSVRRDNTQARRLYLTLGFQLVSGDELSEQLKWHRDGS